MRIALDAMGGDSAPDVEVEGAIQAAPELKGHEIVLVGDEARIAAVAARHRGLPHGVSVRHAPQAVGMDEAPVEAIRRKPDSSIARCIEMADNGEVDAVVSAGNTGAVVALASLKLGLLEGVRRPGIAVALPTRNGDRTLVIDCGANVNCSPEHLYHYGVMASAYATHVFGKKRPRVALLNIGEESIKGNRLVKQAQTLLEASSLHFIGNMEGRDIFSGGADVVVCEGFVGNVLLKVSEGLAETIMSMMKEGIQRTLRRRIGAMLCKYAMIELAAKVDYAEFGGAPLLGVDGTVMICHGGSDRRAIAVAIRVAAEAAAHKVNQHIVADLRVRRAS
ncbi:MAG TPA: phosphate acyltransferase PlsX [Planctomycetota bacterium]|nr:phosphate acyltransferase PlsX [Planctomycetota bacterium]HRR79978.1 phosphate acyltransferase PlsX [Planctomycetota bacterium]HRT94593.1 phosphate acyltransferase PlsX [Planctomycetota bacterium]